MILPQSAIQTAILFILMAVGFAAAKARVLDGETVRRLSRFIVNFVLPCLIIVSMEKPLTPELRDRAFAVLALSFAIYAASFPFAFLLPRLFGLSGAAAGVHGFGIVFANVAFMGFPVLKALFGKDILFEASLATMPFQLLAFSVGAAMVSGRPEGEPGGRNPTKLTIASFVTPAGLASLVGLGLFLLGWRLPGALDEAAVLLGDCTTPLSMCVIGATLADTDLRAALGDWRAWATSAWRLIVFPIAVWLCLRGLGLGGNSLGLLVVMAAMPVAANSTMLAAAYGGDHRRAGALVFLSTVLSLITIPVMARTLFGI